MAAAAFSLDLDKLEKHARKFQAYLLRYTSITLTEIQDLLLHERNTLIEDISDIIKAENGVSNKRENWQR